MDTGIPSHDKPAVQIVENWNNTGATQYISGHRSVMYNKDNNTLTLRNGHIGNHQTEVTNYNIGAGLEWSKVKDAFLKTGATPGLTPGFISYSCSAKGRDGPRYELSGLFNTNGLSAATYTQSGYALGLTRPKEQKLGNITTTDAQKVIAEMQNSCGLNFK